MTINIEYIQNGDYLIPNLTLPADEMKSLGKYGMLRKSYLKQHRKGLYNLMLLEGTLYDHLYEIDEEAHRFMDRVVKEMAEKEGVTETLKAKDQMAWVRAMNSIRSRAEEIVLSELVYGDGVVRGYWKNFGMATSNRQSTIHPPARSIKNR